MATEKAETDRVPITLALSTITYLEKLVRQGTHGTSVPGVARTLVEEGIRLAIKDGLLAIRDNAEHAQAMKAHGIAPIDLLVVNLYPFEATVEKGAGFEECIENIDIGGPAMIRAAAKNHEDVAVAVEAQDYQAVLEELAANQGAFEEALIKAERQGSIPAGRNLRSRARLVAVTLYGLAILGKNGAETATLDDAIDSLVEALTS